MGVVCFSLVLLLYLLSRVISAGLFSSPRVIPADVNKARRFTRTTICHFKLAGDAHAKFGGMLALRSVVRRAKSQYRQVQPPARHSDMLSSGRDLSCRKTRSVRVGI